MHILYSLCSLPITAHRWTSFRHNRAKEWAAYNELRCWRNARASNFMVQRRCTAESPSTPSLPASRWTVFSKGEWKRLKKKFVNFDWNSFQCNERERRDDEFQLQEKDKKNEIYISFKSTTMKEWNHWINQEVFHNFEWVSQSHWWGKREQRNEDKMKVKLQSRNDSLECDEGRRRLRRFGVGVKILQINLISLNGFSWYWKKNSENWESTEQSFGFAFNHTCWPFWDWTTATGTVSTLVENCLTFFGIF